MIRILFMGDTRICLSMGIGTMRMAMSVETSGGLGEFVLVFCGRLEGCVGEMDGLWLGRYELNAVVTYRF